MKPVIIIPARNKAEYIDEVITGIHEQKIDLDIIVVDGNSEDRTRDKVKQWMENHQGIFLIEQNKDTGFGEALRIGFKQALEKNYDPIITMDSNLSHGPEYLKEIIEKSLGNDLVIASRYINGVRVEGISFRKLLVSKIANRYIAYMLIKPVWDFLSAYRCYRQDFLKSIDLDKLRPERFFNQVQLLHLAFQGHFRVKEIPYIYRIRDDVVLKENLNSRIKTFLYVFRYRAPIIEILHHMIYLKKGYEHYVSEYEELINLPRLKNNGKFEIKDNYSISIGVMAYNEEKIIGKCLKALQNQNLQSGKIIEIIVISSGSTDKTDEIVKEFEKQDKRIRLIVQEKRMGKASAINEFLSAAKGDIAIIESADTVTKPETVEELVKPFSDSTIGMCGSHPVPINERDTFTGFCVHKLWELHHYMALDSPKCGEMVAFRNIVPKISIFTAVDEAAIESIFVNRGLKLGYAEKAIVHNKGPDNIKDFIKQRRRIASGHRHLKITTNHSVSTQSPGNIFSYLIKYQKWTPKEIIYTILLIFIEAYSRFAGMIDFYLRDKNPYVWDISKTTKLM